MVSSISGSTQDSLRLTVGATLVRMSCRDVLKTRVSAEVKSRARSIAERECLSESTWLKRLVMREIRNATVGDDHDAMLPANASASAAKTSARDGPARPMLVRLRNDDRLLLDARADARGMRPAAYASVILRAHLRKLTPLPKEELLALKHSVAELGAIGRNINQIARVLNEGGKAPESVREEFWALLKICEALRDHTKGLVKSNIKSWETGDA